MVNGLATYRFAEEVSHEPPPLLLVIPSAAEGSRRIGLASLVGRDLLRQSLRSCLGSARNDMMGDFGGCDTFSAKR